MILESNFDNEEMDDEMCPYADELMYAIYAGKPFGLDWEVEPVCEFLKKLGYKIIDNSIAVKPGEKNIPDENNLVDVFNHEVQKIMLKWLLSKIDSQS